MMVRILSVLPAVVGVVCALLVIGSLYSPALDPSRTNVPLVPCTAATAGCPVGLTNADLSAPTAFMLLEIELTIVIESPPPSGCEPDSNGLTACTADDFEFVAGGDSERDGSMVFQLKSGDYRFATASTDTSGLGGKQLVTITPEVSLNPAAEILLGIVAVLLFAGSGEMFAHNRILQVWQRFKEA